MQKQDKASTTPGQRVAELLRELSTRRRVYPIWVQLRKIKQADADHRMQVLEDIIEDLYQLYPGLRPASTGALFPGDEGRVYLPQHLERP